MHGWTGSAGPPVTATSSSSTARSSGGRSIPDEVREERRLLKAADVAAHARAQIEEAERRGVFEGNPYHGKPLPGIDGQHDPDWWIKSKIEREDIRGIAPPALALRTEDAELDDALDALSLETDVRDVLVDFNARVKEARRQLLGGPPVVTPMRDVEAEVLARGGSGARRAWRLPRGPRSRRGSRRSHGGGGGVGWRRRPGARFRR